MHEGKDQVRAALDPKLAEQIGDVEFHGTLGDVHLNKRFLC